MRIRNRPISFASSFPPASTNLPTPCTNLPKLASLQPPPAAPAPGRAMSGRPEVIEGVAEGRGEARESEKGGHSPQIECCFARALVSGDSGKAMALGHVGMEAWKGRGKKLPTAPAGSGKRSADEDGSNGTLKELLELASNYQAASKGSKRGSYQEAKKRSRGSGVQEWSDDDELILPMKKKSKMKVHKRGNNVGSGSKEQMQELERDEKKELEDAFGGGDVGKSKSTNGKISGGKKTKAGADVGGPLMEGSRCSRINGRGWRCSQLTLVGYSLCEHHLGKARLKSMSSIRGRQSAASRLPQTHNNKINPDHHALINNIPSLDDNGTDDQMPLIEAMKGHANKNVGPVKARSMSSLLGVNTNAHLAS